MATNAEIASKLAAGFDTMTADDGSKRVIITDGTDVEETLKDMVFAADAAGIDWDDAYSMTEEVLDQIADTGPEDLNDLDRDGLIEIYNRPLMEWFARNYDLADEMRSEYGEWPGDSIIDIAQATQDYAYGLVLQAIIDNWPDEETEDEPIEDE